MGKHALTLTRPSQGLLLEDWLYSYGPFDGFAVLAYWCGDF